MDTSEFHRIESSATFFLRAATDRNLVGPSLYYWLVERMYTTRIGLIQSWPDQLRYRTGDGWIDSPAKATRFLTQEAARECVKLLSISHGGNYTVTEYRATT